MMDKHNNYLQEMTATADNRLSYSVIELGIIAARFDWHILTGRAYTAYTMIHTHQHAACVRLWSMHEYLKDTSKRLQWILYSNKSFKRGDTSGIVCLVYTKIYCSGPQRLIWKGKKGILHTPTLWLHINLECFNEAYSGKLFWFICLISPFPFSKAGLLNGKSR